MVPRKANYPLVRNGFTLDVWGGMLILLGGIHDITQELDDVWVFEEGAWT